MAMKINPERWPILYVITGMFEPGMRRTMHLTRLEARDLWFELAQPPDCFEGARDGCDVPQSLLAWLEAGQMAFWRTKNGNPLMAAVVTWTPPSKIQISTTKLGKQQCEDEQKNKKKPA